MHNRRNKMNPLWNSLVIGGVQPDGKSFLGCVTMVGTHYTDSHVATGFASQLARPLFRTRQRDDMSEEEAMTLLHDALRVCYYRDKQSINKFQVAKATAAGTTVSEPFTLDMKWDYKVFKEPTKFSIGAW
jgi:20S proteasome subunit beta 7